jgi:hypothetical protein
MVKDKASEVLIEHTDHTTGSGHANHLPQELIRRGDVEHDGHCQRGVKRPVAAVKGVAVANIESDSTAQAVRQGQAASFADEHNAWIDRGDSSRAADPLSEQPCDYTSPASNLEDCPTRLDLRESQELTN